MSHWYCLLFTLSVCSPTDVYSAGAAAVLHPVPQEADGVPLCQCFLRWSHTHGAVRVRSGVLPHTGFDGALLGSSGKRLNWNPSSIHWLYSGPVMWCWCLCCSLQTTGPLLSQLDWFHVAGIALFLGASLMQHQSMVLLARLRTGKSGQLVHVSLLKTSAFVYFGPFYYKFCILHNF